MADRVIFMGWNRPVVGREQQANQLFQKSMEYWAKMQTDGRIESFEPVLLSAHGGDLNGFILFRGDAKKLAEIREDDDFLNLVTEAGYCLQGFGVISGFINEGLMDIFARWAKLIGE